MPTGYTAKIADGITFKQYALDCARAFGALIMMRDEPADAQIPDEFKPSDYHTKRILENSEKIIHLRAMSLDECAKACQADFENQVNSHKEGIKKDAALKIKYEAMLSEVEKYVAPSPDHEEFKKFMRDQLIESIRFDCGGNYHQEALENMPILNGAEWRNKEIEKCEEDIAYNKKANKEEIERTNGRNKWVKQLRESLST